MFFEVKWQRQKLNSPPARKAHSYIQSHQLQPLKHKTLELFGCLHPHFLIYFLHWKLFVLLFDIMVNVKYKRELLILLRSLECLLKTETKSYTVNISTIIARVHLYKSRGTLLISAMSIKLENAEALVQLVQHVLKFGICRNAWAPLFELILR